MSLQNWEKNSWLVKHKPIAGEAKEMFQLAKELRKDIEVWLGKEHPELLNKK